MNKAATLQSPIFSFPSAVRKTKVQIYKPASRSVLALVYFLAAVNVLLFFSYIWGVNNSVSAGYEISKLQTNLNQLTDANKALNIKMSEISSVSAIQNQSLSQNFVPAGQVKFLQISHYSIR